MTPAVIQPCGEAEGPCWEGEGLVVRASLRSQMRQQGTRRREDELPHDVDRWSALAQDYHQRTERLWNGGSYADTSGDPPAFTAVDDVMLLAPVALELAAEERKDALRPAVRAFDTESVVWPMFAWTAVGAALAVGEHDTAARIAGAVVDRAYGFWDARDDAAPAGERNVRTLPGIACEYWPPSGRCGGEGYGWGAFTTHLLLGNLVGMGRTADGLRVRPNLPIGLRTPGRRYAVRLTLRGKPVTLALRPGEGGRVAVDADESSVSLHWGEDVSWSWAELGCA